jgi:hypothetical protein
MRSRAMRVRLVRRPGQHGTRQYLEEYGDRLVCVRYRYDAATQRRYKTIEIIVDEAPWVLPAGKAQMGTPETGIDIAGTVVAHEDELKQHAPAGLQPPAGAQLLAPSTLVGLRLPKGRPELVVEVERAGGERRVLLGVWALRYDRAVAHGLAEYIIDRVERLAAAWNSQSSRRSDRS